MAQGGNPRRIKRPWTLIVLVAASLALVVVELRSPNRVTTAGRWTVAVFSPFFQGGRWASDRLRDGAVQLIETQAIRLENQRLKRENAQLALNLSVQRERIAKLERERASELPRLPDTILSPLYANVIGISIQRWDHTLIVDRGSLDGVRKSMPVVDFSGAIVGIVSETSLRESIIRLITDPGFSMGAMIEDNASRDQGLLSGLGETDVVQFRPNEPQKLRRLGMEIISNSFNGSLYPRGLRIGKIVRFNKDKYGTDYVYVKPHANFNSIEEVIIVESQTVYRDTQRSVEPPASSPFIDAATEPVEEGVDSMDEISEADEE